MSEPSTSKRNISGVWEFFNIVAEHPHLAKCSMCSKDIRRGKPDAQKKNYQVTSLWDHLKSKHPEEHKKAKTVKNDQVEKKRRLEEAAAAADQVYLLEAQKQMTLEKAFSTELKWPLDSVRQIELEKLLVNWICDNMLPYTTVANSQFLRFISVLNKRFNVPSEKYLRTCLIPELYIKVQYAMVCRLKDMLGSDFYSITCDIWSSRALDSYLSVTVHFVTKNFLRKMVVIRCMPYNASHTGESIKHRLKFVLAAWGMDENKLHTVVSDTASNMRKALEIWDWVACFQHVLNLIVKHSIFTQSGVVMLVKKIKILIKTFRTPTGKRILNEHQLDDSTLIRPCDTRWNSYFFMLQSILKNKAALTLAQQDSELGIPAGQQVGPRDWDLCDKVINLLKPLLLATKACEGDNVSISEVIPWIKKLNHEITSYSTSGVGTLKSSLLAEMDRYFVMKYNIEQRKEYSIATILDPRFKSAGFTKKDNFTLAKELAISEMTPFTEEERGNAETSPNSQPNIGSWSFLDDDLQSEGSQDEAEGIRDQITRYLREPRLSMETDVLQFWKAHKTTYPELSELARRYLCTPPGSAASERVFSKTKHVLKETRHRMSPVHVEMNLFLKLALRAFDYTTNFKIPPTDFKDVVPNSRKLPPPQVMEEQNQEDISDVDISSDTSDDEF